MYRSAASTLVGRYRKKLTAKTSWYKETPNSTPRKRKYTMDEEEEEEMRKNKRMKMSKKPPEEDKSPEEDNMDRTEITTKNKTKAVLFVP